MEELGNIPLPVPPPKELDAIRSFLQIETSRFDKLTVEIAFAIERLQEYRTALITAAVTGKIDVRPRAAKEARA